MAETEGHLLSRVALIVLLGSASRSCDYVWGHFRVRMTSVLELFNPPNQESGALDQMWIIGEILEGGAPATSLDWSILHGWLISSSHSIVVYL